jgi:ABC-2 type transport system ATP-binding protein/lipopolysaccharide transport system ATP-binding protein
VVAPAAEPAVCLTDVSVRFRVPHQGTRSLKEYAIRALQRRVTFTDFWALHHASVEIQAGESFGLVGHNGAGKSTLLKVVARVLRPTTGRVRVRGRVAPLLETAAGFHPDLTGRENVYLNGTLLGLSRAELEAAFDRIVEFAEMIEFIDAPLRTYSSGMVARLGFAIATERRPDVLVVDEVMAVGDRRFQVKSEARVREFHDRGSTIILVSHNLPLVRATCQRAAWLDHGIVQLVGPASEVAEAYARAR